MKRTTALTLGVALVAVGVAGLIGTALLSPIVPPVGVCVGGECGQPTRAGGPAAVDTMFVEQMIPHHDDAIAMAELALERSTRPEIIGLAENIVRTQTAENDLMRGWYREWFGTAVPERSDQGMMGGMMGGMSDLTALEEAEDFDRAFIEAMAPHHRRGVMMATMARRSTTRPEVRELTTTIIRTQSEEIDLMLAWYEDWYGR